MTHLRVDLPDAVPARAGRRAPSSRPEGVENPAQALAAWCRRLARRVARLKFAAPVAHVYNPLQYAQAPLIEYLTRYARPGVPAMLLGMNPGPWGMVQTGVPFGAIPPVRDWLGIKARPKPPPRQHPARPILGFDCPRVEVSGLRLWGWAAERFGTPERFFERFFVANYCPLAFLEASGRNRTPDQLPASEQKALQAVCDAALRELVDLLQPRWVIGVGGFAARRARIVLGEPEASPRGSETVQLGEILHPSPASPAANRGWQAAAERQLADLGLL